MNAMLQFLISFVLLIILTLAAAVPSEAPYLMVCLGGTIMILLAVRSLADVWSRSALWLQLVVSLIFSILSAYLSYPHNTAWAADIAGALPFLVFYEFRVDRRLQIFLPPLLYFCVQIILRDNEMPNILCGVIVLWMLAAAAAFAESMALKYIAVKERSVQAISAAALGELYEKKLNRELTIKNYLADKNARLEERENISRNIHNSAGHSITAAIMTLEAADMLFDTSPDKAREKLNAATERMRKSLNSIRHAVRVLDEENAYISMGDFISGLAAVADSFMLDTRLEIHADFPDSGFDLNIPREHTEFMTGALQELLTNGVRHGNADVFTVHLIADSGHIRLSVSDNGGSDFSSENSDKKIQNGFGLKKIISYAERCGGYAGFENRNGFTAVITLPFTAVRE